VIRHGYAARTIETTRKFRDHAAEIETTRKFRDHAAEIDLPPSTN